MENIKKRLCHDYNLAVKSYNEKDYTSFFLYIRPSIELMAKLIICDMINDELDSSGIIDGSYTLSRNADGTYAMEDNYGRKPSGKQFAIIVPKVFAYKHPEMVSNVADESKKRIRRGIESCCSECARFYDIASGIGNHTDEVVLNVDIQASACTSFILGFFDFLKSYSLISSDTLDFLDGLDAFYMPNDDSVSDAREEIDSLIKQLEVKEAAILEAKAMQLEAEKKKLEAEGQNASLAGQIGELQATINDLRIQLSELQTAKEQLNEESEATSNSDESVTDKEPVIKPRKRLIDILRGPASAWDVEEESMDDDQLDIIDDPNNNKSMLVSGCAGSGKSIIAMHKAEQMANSGASVILIAYTRSLSAFMREGINSNTLPYKFFHHHQWKHKFGMMKADYIIVDEIQDFTEPEIREFMAAAKKAYYFFGDSAQSIYKLYGKQTISIEEISAITGLIPLQLYNNYRLPKPIARITQDYVGVNVNKFEEKVYQNKEKALPHFVKLVSFDEQVNAISELVEKYYTDLFDKRDIGILVPTNDMVMKFREALEGKGIPCEFKYTNEQGEDWQSVDTLDFNTSKPKIMTYHSAKGLQFDVVVLPMCVGASDNESRKALYVAMTRTLHQLYVFYSTEKLSAPLDAVPSRLYLKSL